jgi:hypothetical protein
MEIPNDVGESNATAAAIAPSQPAEQRFDAAFGEIDEETIEVQHARTADRGARFDLAGARRAGVVDIETNDPSFSPRLDALFDDDTTTLGRTDVANPLVVRFKFDPPVSVAAVKIFPSYSTYDWAVRPHAGGPRYAIREAAAETWSRIDLPEPVVTSELQLELRRLERDDHVHLNEVELLVVE